MFEEFEVRYGNVNRYVKFAKIKSNLNEKYCFLRDFWKYLRTCAYKDVLTRRENVFDTLPLEEATTIFRKNIFLATNVLLKSSCFVLIMLVFQYGTVP